MTGIALGDTGRRSRRGVGTYMIDVSMFVLSVASFPYTRRYPMILLFPSSMWVSAIMLDGGAG